MNRLVQLAALAAVLGMSVPAPRVDPVVVRVPPPDPEPLSPAPPPPPPRQEPPREPAPTLPPPVDIGSRQRRRAEARQNAKRNRRGR